MWRTWLIWALSRALLFGAVWLFDADDDITGLAYGWAREVLEGTSPYHEVGVAYPPLAMFLMALPGLVAPDAAAYAVTFALTMLAVDAVGAGIGGLRYVLAVPAIGPVLLLWRYDLAPAVCHLAAAAMALRGRRDASWAWLGAGISLKPYLLVVVPLWWLWDRRGRGLLIAALPSLVAAGAMTALIGTGWVDAYLFQGERAVSVESGPAVVAALLGAGDVALDRPCLCWVRTGIDPAGTAGTALALLLLAAIWWRGRRGRLVEHSLAAVAALLLAAPVFSPQYLVWLLPVAALAGGWSLRLAAAAAFTGFLAYPLLYDAVLDGDALPLLIARLLLLAALVAIASMGGEERPAAP